MESISILGAGSWGTSLAISLSDNVDVKLWTRNQDVLLSIENCRENQQYLPGYKIPKNVSITSSFDEVTASSVVIIAVPTQFLRNLCTELKKQNPKDNIRFILGCKGIEQSTLMFPSEVASKILTHNSIAVLSGPSFAAEVAQKFPCSIILACENTTISSFLISKLSNNNIKLHQSTDLIGVQICAALKNVIAIACGIILGKGIGYSTHAAIISKGIEEIKTMYLAKIGSINIDTVLGLAGLGDLVMTCNALNSRNMAFGFDIGKNNGNVQQILSKSKAAIEGAATAKAVSQLAAKLNISMPVCEAIYKLLYKEVSIEETISSLLK